MAFMPIDSFSIMAATTAIIIPPASAAGSAVLPDLYEYFPQIIKSLDVEMVDRGMIPLYYWDTIPDWDVSPYTWDEMIGPEPILQATTRVMQLQLERTAKEIRDLYNLYNLDRADRKYLPYISDYLGSILPSTSVLGQRNFLKNIVRIYRKKGTPLSFHELFKFLGFNATIIENYQRKTDAESVTGPQKDLVPTALVQREPVATLGAGAGPYTIQFLKTPLVRGGIQLLVYNNSANTPSVLIDNGDGSWSNNIVGSINYETGAATFTLVAGPTYFGGVYANYSYQTDPFPDPFNKKWTNRFRSSIVSAVLSPITGVTLTIEMQTRLLLYLNLLKPAHIIIQPTLGVVNLEDTESVTDTLNPLSYLHIESLFGTLYRGYGWHVEDNGSLSVDPAYVGNQARTGMEFIRTYAQDPEEPPYVYPFFRDGKFYQPNAADKWETGWISPLLVFASSVTNDVAIPTTANFSIDKLAGTALTVNDKVCFTSGPLAGEQSTITIFTAFPAYYDVTVSPVLPLAPVIGNTLTIVDADGVNRNGLVNRPQDPLDLYFIQDIYAGTGLQLIFAGSFLGKLTVSPSGITMTFISGGITYNETDNGIGGFSNTSGLIGAASVIYVTGAVDVTFTAAPDALTFVRYTYTSVTSANMGGF